MAGVSLCAATIAAAFEPHAAPGRLLLELRDGVSVHTFSAKAAPGARNTGRPSLDALAARFAVQRFEPQFPGETHASKAIAGTDLSSFYVVEFPESVDLEMIRAAFAADPAVAYAGFDILEPVFVDVNDVAQQWYLESSQGKDTHATGGWNHSIGDTTVILAIGDTGVDWQHPDLGGTGPNYTNGNIWINWAEYNGQPGVDDDANGKIDDVRGWDFISSLGNAWSGEDASTPDNDPRDFNGHGTHVAGIAGAMTNNGLGVAGVGWRCRIMALRIGGSVNDLGVERGVISMSAAAEAINYARQKGAVAFNCSWGSSSIPTLQAAVDAAVAQGMVLCVAAGNDNSTAPEYLAFRGDCFDVAATTTTDAKASFSNYGSWVDVAAPGVSIYSTYYDHHGPQYHTYATLQGTSMAAPIVTGLVGLVKAHTPALTGAQIKTAIRAGCDDLSAVNPGFSGLLGSGRVNALRTFKDYHLTVPVDYSTFEKALAASGPGDTLALRGGDLYTTPVYLWKKNVRIEGGWNSSFTSRDPVDDPTLVSVPSNGPAVEVVAGMDATLVVDGLSFSGGKARQLTTPLAGYYGGGVLCIDASPTFQNCRFTSNAAGDVSTFGGGGGGFFANSSAKLVDCVFSGNSARAGAGLYAYNSNVSIEGGRVGGNSIPDVASATTGGGIHVEGGTLTLDGVTIEDNVGADEGGGVYVKSATLNADGVVFSGNAAGNNGGHLQVASGGVAVLAGTEMRNGAAPFGGAIGAVAGTSLTLTSCLLAGNVASFVGGGVYATGATGTFRNVTWNANRGNAGGFDAVYAGSCPAPWVIRNCLVSNHPVATKVAMSYSGAAPQLDYNTFWSNAGGNLGGGVLGPNDRIEDPLYVNAAAGDVALGLHSPALDSGDPAAASNDPDGSRNDRGAYGGPNARSRAPAVPTGLAVVRTTNPLRNTLSWNPGPSADVQFFAVYRGSSAGFVPGAASFIGSVPAGTQQFQDPAGSATAWYRLAAVDSSAASSGFGPSVQPSSSTDTESGPAVPSRLVLHQNEPNPFNPATLIRYELPAATSVRLVVYDSAGRLVCRLVDETRPAGPNVVRWDGRDAHGRPVSSGVYVARIEAGNQSTAQTMVLVR